MTLRGELLDEANVIVTTQRNCSYGPPHQGFVRIAEMLNALGFRGPDGVVVSAHHVAMMMVCLKLSRLTWDPLHRDNWTDVAGYAACGYEAAVLTEGSADDAEERGDVPCSRTGGPVPTPRTP